MESDPGLGKSLLATVFIKESGRKSLGATQVLAASIRHTAHIIQCIEVGADVATCPLSAIKGLLNLSLIHI